MEKECLINVIPDKGSVIEAMKVYYRFYSKEQEEKFGVVAIKIEKMEENERNK